MYIGRVVGRTADSRQIGLCQEYQVCFFFLFEGRWVRQSKEKRWGTETKPQIDVGFGKSTTTTEPAKGCWLVMKGTVQTHKSNEFNANQQIEVNWCSTDWKRKRQRKRFRGNKWNGKATRQQRFQR